MSEPLESDIEPPKKPRRRWLRWIGWLVIVLVVGLITAELVLRICFGLGNPPLMMVDPDMEYRFQPSQTVHRFGNLIHINAYSQRSEDFPQHKSSPNELRVLLIGDSIINGGSQTDQSQLINTILERRLSDDLHHKVIVANASAPSWGPPNELAYLKKFGLFDADVVVLVLNDEDAYDAMTFNRVIGVKPDLPDHRPLLALTELWTRYVPKYTARFKPPPAPDPEVPKDRALPICMDAIRQIVGMARAHGAEVLIAEHHCREEFSQPAQWPFFKTGRQAIRGVARELGIEPIEWDAQLKQAQAQGKDAWRPGDYMHPSPLGDQIIADALYQPIEQALASRARTQSDEKKQ